MLLFTLCGLHFHHANRSTVPAHPRCIAVAVAAAAAALCAAVAAARLPVDATVTSEPELLSEYASIGHC